MRCVPFSIRLLTLLLAGLAAPLAAQSVPATINFQGRLTDNTPAQNPVNATVPMAFSIWDNASGGAVLWSEPAGGGTSVLVVNGIFNVALGSTVPLPASVFSGATTTRYLQIIVNPGPSQELLTPRQLISATAYANQAQNAASAVSANNAATVTNGVYTTGSYSDPAWITALSGAKITGGLSAASITSGNLSAARLPTGGNWALASNLTIDTSTLAVDQLNNRVGVGTATPDAALTVASAAASPVRLGDSGCGAAFAGIGLFGPMAACLNYTLAGDSSATHHLYLNRPSGAEMRFRINNSEQMLLDQSGSLMLDQGSTNNGLLNNGNTAGTGLTFGANSGEGIASKRTAAGNQFGLDFYTNFTNRLSISQAGNVGIGTAPAAQKLQVAGNIAVTGGYQQSGAGGEVLRMIRGEVDGYGNIMLGSGFTVSLTGGQFTINLATAFSALPTVVAASRGFAGDISVAGYATTPQQLLITTKPVGGPQFPNAFSFIAIGPP